MQPQDTQSAATGDAGKLLQSSSPASPAEPYRPRSTVKSGDRSCCGWQLKIYEITMDGVAIPTDVIDAAMECARDGLAWPTEAADKFGFAILHKGKDAVWLLVNLWMNDILRQFVFLAPLSDPSRFDVSPLPGFNSCVWELEVIRHERDAWVEHVMSSPAEPHFDRYMRDALEIS